MQNQTGTGAPGAFLSENRRRQARYALVVALLAVALVVITVLNILALTTWNFRIFQMRIRCFRSSFLETFLRSLQ